MVLDLGLTKTVTAGGGSPAETRIRDTGNPVLTVIRLPAELQGRSSCTIYRFHDVSGGESGETLEMQTITAAPNSGGEYLEATPDGTADRIYAEFYSSYVLTWEQRAGGSSSGRRYPVNLPTKAVWGTVVTNPPFAEPGCRVTLTAEPEEGYHLGSLTVRDRNESQWNARKTATGPAVSSCQTAG